MTQFKPAAVFSNHMVLQRNKNIFVFGQGEEDKTVLVEFNGRTYSKKIKNGKWSVLLPPMEAGTEYEMIVSCGNEKKHFNNIAIGEVWLAGGQSNMEYELQNCTGDSDMLKNDVNPNVRFFYSNKMSYIDECFY